VKWCCCEGEVGGELWEGDDRGLSYNRCPCRCLPDPDGPICCGDIRTDSYLAARVQPEWVYVSIRIGIRNEASSVKSMTGLLLSCSRPRR